MEMGRILNDFHRVMQQKATLHVIVPDLKAQAEKYLSKNRNGEPLSADEFIKETLLTRESRGSRKYRLLEFLGAFGLQHHWMYDYSSITKKLRDVGFKILEANETPSKHYRLDDGSVHVVACKE
jgi:predicted SAM-dependent methyltransferase